MQKLDVSAVQIHCQKGKNIKMKKLELERISGNEQKVLAVSCRKQLGPHFRKK